MKDRARDEERFHLEALEEDKEDTMEFEDRPTYEQDNEDGMLEMEKREAYESIGETHTIWIVEKNAWSSKLGSKATRPRKTTDET